MDIAKWIALFSAVQTGVIGYFAWQLTRRQVETGRNKLRLDLFEKREAVFNATQEALVAVAARGSISELEVQSFHNGTRGARWLFGPEIHQYLSSTLSIRFELIRVQSAKLKSMDASLEMVKAYDESRVEVSWFFDELAKLEGRFSPYLMLRD